MSQKRMQACWTMTKLKPYDKMTLLVIADQVNDLGYGRISMDSIVEKAQCARRTAIACAQRLAEAGHLLIFKHSTGPNSYIVTPGLTDSTIKHVKETYIQEGAGNAPPPCAGDALVPEYQGAGNAPAAHGEDEERKPADSTPVPGETPEKATSGANVVKIQPPHYPTGSSVGVKQEELESDSTPEGDELVAIQSFLLKEQFNGNASQASIAFRNAHLLRGTYAKPNYKRFNVDEPFELEEVEQFIADCKQLPHYAGSHHLPLAPETVNRWAHEWRAGVARFAFVGERRRKYADKRREYETDTLARNPTLIAQGYTQEDFE